MTKETKQSAKAHHAEAANEKTYELPSAFDLFAPSVNLIRNNAAAFLILVGIPTLLALFNQQAYSFNDLHEMFAAHGHAQHNVTPIGALGLLLGLLAAPGIIYLQIAGVRNKTPDFKEAFLKGLHYFWRFVGTGFLLGLMLMVSLLLLIVPFFILLPRVVLSFYYLIDRDLGPVEAIKASMADYKKHKGTWGVVGVNVLIGMLGVLPIIGWIASAVVGFLYRPAMAIRYEQIKEMTEGKPPRTPIEVASITD